MTLQRRLLTLVGVALLGLAPLGLAADVRAADVATHVIEADINDAGIDATRGQNLIWLPPESRRVGKLLVFLPFGGVNNRPPEFEEIGSEGGRLGYHTIVIAYKNEAPIALAPPLGCGNGEEASTAPTDCAILARREILDGDGESTVVNVDRANSIENRLIKVLEYLKAEYPEEGWARFLDTTGAEPVTKWSETVIAGGSLGAGQAALIASKDRVHRAALFAGWTDARHEWVTLDATPSSRYSTLIHARENFFGRTCYAYRDLGLVATCPQPEFTPFNAANPLFIDSRDPPYDAQQLVFNLQFAPNQPPVADPYHASTVRDGYIAKEADGTTPSRALVNAWRSTLGDSDADTLLDDIDKCPRLASANQDDADGDGTGDACDPTPQGTTPPTIVVPAHITVNATGPAGASVPYTVTATDDIRPAPSPVCTPSAGSLFAIGDTSVACTATDGGGNTANASFLVTVLGAKEQLANLIRKVIDSTSPPAPVKTQLIASLQSLVAGFDPNKPLQRKLACLTLRVFTTLVRYAAPPAQAAEWTSDANRIREVLAC